MSVMRALGRHHPTRHRTSNLDKQPRHRHVGNEIPPHRHVEAWEQRSLELMSNSEPKNHLVVIRRISGSANVGDRQRARR